MTRQWEPDTLLHLATNRSKLGLLLVSQPSDTEGIYTENDTQTLNQ